MNDEPIRAYQLTRTCGLNELFRPGGRFLCDPRPAYYVATEDIQDDLPFEVPP